jgi:hypothetical protein
MDAISNSKIYIAVTFKQDAITELATQYNMQDGYKDIKSIVYLQKIGSHIVRKIKTDNVNSYETNL